MKNIIIQGTQFVSHCGGSNVCMFQQLSYSSNVCWMLCSIIVPLVISNYNIISDLESQVRSCQISTKGLTKADTITRKTTTTTTSSLTMLDYKSEPAKSNRATPGRKLWNCNGSGKDGVKVQWKDYNIQW